MRMEYRLHSVLNRFESKIMVSVSALSAQSVGIIIEFLSINRLAQKLTTDALSGIVSVRLTSPFTTLFPRRARLKSWCFEG